MESTHHILIVDDHRDIRDSLSKYLAQHDYRTSIATDAADARKQIDRGAFDLVVLDIMMPGEDGLSLCRHLRQTTDLPIILLTAVAEETDRVVGLEMGADDPQAALQRYEMLRKDRADRMVIHSRNAERWYHYDDPSAVAERNQRFRAYNDKYGDDFTPQQMWLYSYDAEKAVCGTDEAWRALDPW